ncbi:hypothetical protein [Saccharospirillum salsuginis]|uniref:Cytochrome c domain-containing protein n=1 Tax=Saccharospirillum salsuginis TaxID=418750 RepID=A0A918KE07_9GAMM|nr:hypothetical protein [Saccharospirillum salsuginis]GGX58550.1 hypothetical protein GCM10007392_28070 [Saccharospirillum salsuginis]
MRWLLWGLCIAGLAGCNPAVPGDVQEQDESDPVSGTTEGDATLPLDISGIRFTERTPGPVMVVLETELPTEADVQVYVDGYLVKEEAIPRSCQVLPAVTVCEDSVFRKVPVMIERSGEMNVEVVAMKGDRWRSESFSQTITLASCQSNQATYESELQPILRGSCERCHGNGNAGVFTADDTWPQFRTSLINRGDAFYRYPSGQDPGHDAHPFSPYDATYRLMAEMLWRAEGDFSCS